jgi:hypothetical protein
MAAQVPPETMCPVITPCDAEGVGDVLVAVLVPGAVVVEVVVAAPVGGVEEVPAVLPAAHAASSPPSASASAAPSTSERVE